MPIAVKKGEQVEGQVQELPPANETTPVKESKEGAAQRKSYEHLTTLIKGWALSARQTDEQATACLVACLEHFERFGDARPMDDFIKAAPSTVNVQPYLFWIKSNSPIYWDAKKNVKVRKAKTDDGQVNPDYVPLNMERAKNQPWNQTEAYKKLQRKSLEPLSLKTFFERIHNLRKQLQNVQKDTSQREFDASWGSEDEADKFLDKLAEFIKPYEKKAERKHAGIGESKKTPKQTSPRKSKSAETSGVAGHA